MDELTGEFLAESREALERMESCVTELESRPGDGALIAEIFRAVHTMKGATGFLGFDRLEALAHTGENLLSELRSGRIPVTSDLISGLLALHDGLQTVLRLIEKTGCEGERSGDDDSDLIARLVALGVSHLTSPEVGSGKEVPTPAASFLEVGTHPHEQQLRIGDETERRTVLESRDSSVRVDTEVLNRLMNLVADLVVTRNGILRTAGSGQQSPALVRSLDCITSELRSVVMEARMQPVDHLFGKFPRMLRDLARACGRRARLEFDAHNTELDKTLLEAVRDPLTHAIRNAVDHGIEPPEERIRLGKNPEGLIRLHAYGQGGGVVIEVSDDGAGIATDRVIKRAIAHGLVTAERAAQLSAEDALRLLFEPGFSTAAAITCVSGRGVGLDVVRANVEKVGGHVELESKPGYGTVLRLHMPLTLAIIPALLVRSSGQSFAIPQSRLIELVYIAPKERPQLLERIGSTELLRRGRQLLPIVWLSQVLALPEDTGAKAAGFFLAVVESDAHRYALAVEKLLAPEEIVVKPLSPLLRQSGTLAGAGILAGGELAMILDIGGIGQRAGVGPHSGDSPSFELSDAVPGTEPFALEDFLVYELRSPSAVGPAYDRVALPLSAVERILHVARSSIQSAGAQNILPYDGDLLPVEDQGDLLAAPADELTVVISGGQRRVAIVVSEVVNICSLPAGANSSCDSLVLIEDEVTQLRRETSSAARSLEEVA